ncbi:Metalloenzyme, LuxS/M16 peptidase-like protein [Schizophyllum amplum]|uniref:Cytochrome b-c1 complex subunit 2, mitochondrial n=1 Tax=Schizophyllum amplum TaxID=97359 RepID=A0A550C7C6_9AGAR|nr:Metalloenzyme, LuxS/M16 peptidase-like protein [Auriculariopsis ampla]
MLASRATAARNVQRITRSFATVADSAGVKVAAVDFGQPTSSVTLLVKAGSRFEPKTGVAHALKNFAFKSTAKRSALGTVRESELYGGVLSSTLSREHLALTAEFLRGDEELFVDLLTTFATSAKFTRHEYLEYVTPIVEGETAAAASNPAVRAVELAHALAFRSGLGASLFAPAHTSVTHEDVKAFASSVFGKGNIAVLGTGIDQARLAALVEKSSLASLGTSTTSTSPSTYFGGETRLDAHAGAQTVFIGFGSTGSPAELAALAAYLSVEPALKWSQSSSALAAAIPEGASVKPVFLPYSDATLVGLLVQGQTPAAVKAAGTAAVKAIKSAGSIKDSDLKKAGRDGILSVLGSKVLAGADASLESSLSSLDKLAVGDFTKTAEGLLKNKPTYVAVGDIAALPFADELGL